MPPSLAKRTVHSVLDNVGRRLSWQKRPQRAPDVGKIHKVKNAEYVSSYNWIQVPGSQPESHPTMAVPGSPKLYRPKKPPFTLQPGKADTWIDQNAAKSPKSNLLPLFLAVDSQQPDFDWKRIDVVTDRNNLRKLHECIFGLPDKLIRIDVELVGNTLLLRRWEEQDVDVHKKRQKTFGTVFEEAMTVARPGLEHATGHHRICTVVRFILAKRGVLSVDKDCGQDVGPLKMLLRYEVDAFVDAPESSKGKTPDQRDSSVLERDTVAFDTAHTATMHGIDVLRIGQPVEQSDIAELATVAASADLGLALRRKFIQMYLSQTSRLFLGSHNNGTFRRVRSMTLAALRRLQGNALRQQLTTMFHQLTHIRDLARQQPDGKLVLIYEQDMDDPTRTGPIVHRRPERQGVLRAYAGGRGSGLVDDILARFKPPT